MHGREGVKAVQQLLRALGEPIAVDGVAGPKTRAAVLKHSADDLVSAVTGRFPLPSNGRVFVPEQQIEAAIRDTVLRYSDVPSTYLRLVVRLENYPALGGVETTFGGKYQGLGQFGQAAWDDVRDNEDPTLGSYEKGVRDVNLSIRAIAGYHRLNRRRVRNAAPKLYARGYSDELAYLAHNQGAGGAARLFAGGGIEGEQSAEARRLIQRVIGKTV